MESLKNKLKASNFEHKFRRLVSFLVKMHDNIKLANNYIDKRKTTESKEPINTIKKEKNYNGYNKFRKIKRWKNWWKLLWVHLKILIKLYKEKKILNLGIGLINSLAILFLMKLFLLKIIIIIEWEQKVKKRKEY